MKIGEFLLLKCADYVDKPYTFYAQRMAMERGGLVVGIWHFMAKQSLVITSPGEYTTMIVIQRKRPTFPSDIYIGAITAASNRDYQILYVQYAIKKHKAEEELAQALVVYATKVNTFDEMKEGRYQERLWIYSSCAG